MSLKKILLLLFSIAAFFGKAQISLGEDQIDYANPKEYNIASIMIEGTQSLDQNAVKLLSGLNIGDKIMVPGDEISDAIKELWKQGLFNDVKIYSEKIVNGEIFLIIQIEEKPRLSKFTFRGVKKAEEEDLRDRMQLVRTKVLTDYIVEASKNEVIEYFVDDGFRNVKVEMKLEKDTATPGTEILYIIVTKGRRIKINDIHIHGNEAISDAKLRRSLKDTRRKKWWDVFHSAKYLEDNYEKDKPLLIAKYGKLGYRDAKITKDTVYNFDEKTVNIEMTISEGKKYYFRNITWVGNSKHTSARLNQILDIKKGDVFDQTRLEERIYMNPNGADVSSLYMDDGYLFFQINPVEVLVVNDSIDLELRIYEGKQAIINNVVVVGNTKTNDHVIMREIRTRPGQLFSRSDIIRSQRELAQLGYFDPEKMAVNPTPNQADGTVDIEYVVAEKPSDQIELSGGWGAGRIVGTFGISFNNFSARNMFKKGTWRPLPAGDGQKLSVRAQSNGLFFQSYNVSFTEPWLGGKKPNALSVTAYHSIQSNGQKKYSTIDGEKTSNTLRQSIDITGVSVGLGRRLKWPDDFFTTYVEANYQHYVLNNFASTFSFSEGFSNNLSYKFILSRNSVDKPLEMFPTNGSKLNYSAQFTVPYSYFNDKDYKAISDQEKYRWVEYHKHKFTAAWYNQITKRQKAEGSAYNLVLYTKAGFGFLGMYNKDVGLAPFERFYLGGSGLSGFALDGREIIALRGYEDQSLSPRTGGAFITKYTAELRYPISLNPSATIWGHVFAEAGNSWNVKKDFSPFSDIKRSAGFGLKIFLPMFGLLGFDYGWGFDQVPSYPSTGRVNGKAIGQFHFTIGAILGEL